jgi:hypothetical protein
MSSDRLTLRGLSLRGLALRGLAQRGLSRRQSAAQTQPAARLFDRVHAYWLALALANLACLGLMGMLLFK